jgi:hypothetical protein
VNQKEYVMTFGKRITAALGVLATTAVLCLAGTGAGTANASDFTLNGNTDFHSSILNVNNVGVGAGPRLRLRQPHID